MMSTKYTELSTSDDQLTCFAHLLTFSHLHWQIVVTVNYISEGKQEHFCVLIVKKILEGPFLNIESLCVMCCVVHRCSGYMCVGVAMPL